MHRIIKADLYRYGGLKGFKGFIHGMFIPGFRYVYLLRKAANRRKYSFIRIFLELLKRRYGYKYGFQIPTKVELGEGFYIGHFGTVVINSKVKIGINCTITHGVTIGQANRGKLKGYPIIGNNVWIGSGAVIVGNVKIGSNIMIAPNAFVNTDVPDNSLVVGNPAKIIQQENPTEGYINFVLHED